MGPEEAAKPSDGGPALNASMLDCRPALTVKSGAFECLQEEDEDDEEEEVPGFQSQASMYEEKERKQKEHAGEKMKTVPPPPQPAKVIRRAKQPEIQKTIRTDADDTRRWIDVAVRIAMAGNTARVHPAARRPGEAACRGEREKQCRYPGEQLTAFVVKHGGRLGGGARQWLRRHIEQLPDDMQTNEALRAYKVVSCAVQSQIARQLRAASGMR